MKKKSTVYLFALVLVLLVQCKNDVKILAPYKDVTVVYGVLDQNDTVHYIRVNKAYQGLGNALTMAQQYDSINYPPGTLKVQLEDSATNAVITLDTTTAIPLEPGIFSAPYQVLYKTSQVLDSTHIYNLIVTNTKTGKVCRGTTRLLPDENITSPKFFMSNGAIYIDPDTVFNIIVEWESNAQAVIYQLTLRFYYDEINLTTNDTTHGYVDWVFGAQTSPKVAPGYPMSNTITGRGFLQFLKGSISPLNGRPLKRVARNIEVMFTCGSLDLNTYITLSQPSLTVNQEKPFFTDLKNAIGIFTSRHTQSALKPLSPATINMIDTSSLIAPLNIK